MSFLPRVIFDDGSRRLTGEAVFLRHPEPGDYATWADLRETSRSFLAPWEPTWSKEELTRASFRRRLRRYSEDIRDGVSFPFFVFRREDEALLGGVTLGQVRRGVSQSAAIGYWVGAPYQRMGFTGAAVRLVIHFAFEDLRLHRLEAACLPDNAASRTLLEGVGFECEGLARAYLKIAGAWRDHLLFGLVNPRGSTYEEQE